MDVTSRRRTEKEREARTVPRAARAPRTAREARSPTTPSPRTSMLRRSTPEREVLTARASAEIGRAHV